MNVWNRAIVYIDESGFALDVPRRTAIAIKETGLTAVRIGIVKAG